MLRSLLGTKVSSQRELAQVSDLSLGSANAAYRNLVSRGYITSFNVTPSGRQALCPYRVRNAVILAAGMPAPAARITHEKPKALFSVRGEILIERQIRQLQAAGINDITVVIGYEKEYFFYLEDAFGVSLAINDEYQQRNNTSSLKAVEHKLGNTYICSSDDYFTQNLFERYVYTSYYASQFIAGPTQEWCATTGAQKRITHISMGGADAWVLLGHAYFDRAFAKRFLHVLNEEYDKPETAHKPWEELIIDHIREFDLTLKPYPKGLIHEFDSIDEISFFDLRFLENVDSEVFDHIAQVLPCSTQEITHISPLDQGTTNLLCHFTVGDHEYVYRHCATNDRRFIDRRSECDAEKLASELGLDTTFIHEDTTTGWKLSHFVRGARPLDTANTQDIDKALRMMHTLHNASTTIRRRFDFYDEAKRYEALIRSHSRLPIPDFDDMASRIDALHKVYLQDTSSECLCHNDLYADNFLIAPDGTMNIIDWEYAGIADIAQDFGAFVVRCRLSQEEVEPILARYLNHTPSPQERRHYLAAVAFAGWCWYVWSLYHEEQGDFTGKWLYTYYRYAKRYTAQAATLYDAAQVA